MTGIHTEPSLCVKVFLTQGPLARKGYLYSIESKRVGRIPLRTPARKNAHRSHFAEFDEYCPVVKKTTPQVNIPMLTQPMIDSLHHKILLFFEHRDQPGLTNRSGQPYLSDG